MFKDTRKVTLFFLFFSFFLYFNSLNVPFYFDDQHMIDKNLFVKNPKYIPQLFKGYVTSYPFPQGMCRPFLMLTFALNYFGGGLNTLGYHLINVLFHFLNAVVLYLLLKYFKKDSPPLLIFMITLLFLSHPINTEAVTYISSRSDLMATLFIGLSFLNYIKRNYFISFLCYASALLSKETGLCLPLLIFAYDFIFNIPYLKLSFIFEKWKKEKRFNYYLILIFITIAYLIYNKTFFQSASSHVPLRSYYSNMLIQASVTLFYLKLFLYPFSLNLEHYFPSFNTIFHPLAFFSVMGIITLFILILISRKKYPLLAFGVCWYLLGLLPKFYARLNILAAEHQFYLPSIGLYLVILALTGRIYLKYKRYYLYASIGIIFIFSVLVCIRNYEWSSPIRLWTVSAQRGLGGIAWNNLAIQYKEKGDWGKAEELLKKALETAMHKKSTVGEVLTRGNLGLLYFEQGKLNEAKEMAEKVLQEDSSYYLAYLVLGNVFWKEGKEKEALAVWHKGLEKFPYAWGIYESLANFYLEKNDFEKAKVYAQKALEYNPESWYASMLLGKLLERENMDLAINTYKKAISINPKNHDLHFSLGMAYIKKREYLEASRELEEVVRIKPDFSLAYYNLAIIFAQFSQWDLANQYIAKAEELGYKADQGLLEKIKDNMKN